MQDQNVFDSKKKIKVATAGGLQQKLTAQQRQAISMNQCLLYMYTNQVNVMQITVFAVISALGAYKIIQA